GGAPTPRPPSRPARPPAPSRAPDRRAELLAGPLPRLTGRTLISREVLEATLEAVVDSGVALEDQEAIVGEAGIAAALFDNRGAVVGALGRAARAEVLR